MSVAHAASTIERHYGFTPQQTLRAFSDPELKRQWFGLEEPAEREHGTSRLLDALARFLAGERVR